MTISIIASSDSYTNPTDFTFIISPPIILEESKAYEVSLIKSSMYYSWTNISPQQNNNTFEYSTNSGTSWNTISFPEGNYSIDEINSLVPSDIQLLPIQATQKVQVVLSNNHQVRFTVGRLYNILGFNQGSTLTQSIIAPNKADFTDGVETLLVHCDLVERTNSYLTNSQSQVLYSVSPPTHEPGTLYNIVEPGSNFFLGVNKKVINQVHLWVTDQKGRKINNLNENITYHLLIKQVN